MMEVRLHTPIGIRFGIIERIVVPVGEIHLSTNGHVLADLVLGANIDAVIIQRVLLVGKF
jgi:hypothetical protein